MKLKLIVIMQIFLVALWGFTSQWHYFGFLDAFNKSLTIPALWSLIIFMTGIGAGRAISLFTDGMPSNPYLLFLLLEVVFASVGFMFVKTYESN